MIGLLPSRWGPLSRAIRLVSALPKTLPSPRRVVGFRKFSAGFIAGQLPHANIKKFEEGYHVVTLNDDDEGTFHCDAEPHMLSPPFGPGYIPLKFGEIVKSPKNEYEIVRKLGWGTGSSVWLARRCDDQTSYVALKILTCHNSARIDYDEGYELEALTRMRKDSGTSHPGRTYCTDAIEIFAVSSKHGGHMCFAFRPHSISLQGLLVALSSDGHRLRPPIPTIASILRQTLLGVSYLHSLGMVHTDIKVSNLFMTIDNELHAIGPYLHDNPSETYPPRHEPSLSSEPIVTALTEPLPPFGLKSFKKLGIRLGDFGEAIPTDKITETLIAMPTGLRAPEIILGCKWGQPVDIWAIGCLALELVTRTQIFDLDAPPDMTFTDMHIARIAELLGPFPPSLLNVCARKNLFFDDAGNLNKPVPEGLTGYTDIKTRLRDSGLRDKELDLVEQFINRCLCIDPALRPSASELLQDSLLVEYNQPTD